MREYLEKHPEQIEEQRRQGSRLKHAGNMLVPNAVAAAAAAVREQHEAARINGHDPYAYFKDVLERLPTHPANRIDELLPHRWTPHGLAGTRL